MFKAPSMLIAPGPCAKPPNRLVFGHPVRGLCVSRMCVKQLCPPLPPDPLEFAITMELAGAMEC